jgi:hypothetical protein
MFTVYSHNGSETFESDTDARAWAEQQHGLNGGTYECRDEDFNLVFVIED